MSIRSSTIGMAGVVLAVGILETAASQDPVQDLMARVGERVLAYSQRLQSILCTETVERQELSRDLTPDGPWKAFTYDVRIEPGEDREGDGPSFSAVRTLRLVNGRPPRGRQEPDCMDPREVYTEPLSFLLPGRQSAYAFTPVGDERVDGQPALVIEFQAVVSEEPSVSWEDNCFTMSAEGHTKGRLWLHAETLDVLRVDSHLIGPLEFRVPASLISRGASHRLALTRSDTSIRYRYVTFTDPEETVLLPASVHNLTVVQGAAVPRFRTTQEFTEYRRFVTEGRILP